MRIVDLTSRSNPILRHAASLSEKKNREKSGQYRFEGEKLLAEALRSGAELRDVFFDASFENRRADWLAEAASGGACLYRVSRDLLDRLALAESGSPVVVCASLPQRKQVRELMRAGGLYLFAEGVQDAGNLGTMIRTAEAFGLDGLFAGEGCADVFGEKAVRAAMGSHFRLPLARGVALDELFETAEETGLPVLGAALGEGASLVGEVRFGGGAVVAVGSEGRGLSAAFLARCRQRVRVPMAGPTESLNAAVAAGVLMWEMTRGRRGDEREPGETS